MSYSTTLPNLSEAARDAIKAQMVSKLSLLNSALSRDAITPIGTLTASMIIKGDPTKLQDVSAAPVLFCIKSGGRPDTLDRESEQILFPRQTYSGMKHTIYTNICVYIHPKTLPNDDAIAQAAARETLVERLVDWLSESCFNSDSGAALTLGSRVYAASPNFDTLEMGTLTDISVTETQKSYGDTQTVLTIQARHQGIVQ